MKKISRILIFIILILLIIPYFTSIWEITLDAPQYPEGLSMTITLNSIEGDLNTINGLNHYIGMAKINPESFPELKLMGWCLGVLIFMGFLVLVFAKKWLFTLWMFIYMFLGTIGTIDFYQWEYKYGHDLNPHAAIKVPGMSYQPPLWGEKQLLNFTAYSYPGIGGYIIIFSGVALFFLLIYELKFNRKKR